MILSLDRMRIAVVSHKICTKKDDSPSGYVTDGGFPLQMEAISELFAETRIVVPCRTNASAEGLSPIEGKDLRVFPLSVPEGVGLKRKALFPLWLLRNSLKIWREVRAADAVHAPIPGDVGTVGMVFALVLGKPLFVRHCGNWLWPVTNAERFWKWSMERFAGGRNVMLATGGGKEPPSGRNPNIGWIFSTTLQGGRVGEPRNLSNEGGLRLITACRLEERKGVDVVIQALKRIRDSKPDATLKVIGGGSLEQQLRQLADKIGLRDSVEFTGRIEQSRVMDELKSAHVFCFPTAASEGFPKVVIEALACGLPVVTTRVSVLSELVTDEVGFALEGQDVEAHSEAVLRITADKDEYRRRSSAAIERSQGYTLDRWQEVIGQRLRNSWIGSSSFTGGEVEHLRGSS